MKNQILFFLLSFLFGNILLAQQPGWKALPSGFAKAEGSLWNRVQDLSVFEINHEALRTYLSGLSSRSNDKTATLQLELPFPDGALKNFTIKESPVMEEGLALKYPEIKTFSGTDGEHYMRLSISPYSFQAFILTEEGDIVIESMDKKNLNQYVVFYGKNVDIHDQFALSCGTKDLETLDKMEEPQKKAALHSRSMLGEPVNLRTYRLALTCTGEWGENPNLGGGSIATALDKMVAALSYINAVYEKEVSVHMNLITNNDKLIHLVPQTDPYINPTSGGATLGVNTDVITAIVGRAAYDIGHVFTISCTDVGGVAFLGSVCNGNKGGGVTCWYTTDIAYVTQRIVCHEMGHQFNASHTFSNCNGNESATSYEPGSGTTIMSYSGLCGAGLNVESGSLPHPNYFHSNSVERIYNYTRVADGNRCGSQSATSNTFPDAEILFPSGLYIPISTPFVLKGQASDAEKDNLSYNWEQYNAGSYGPVLGEPSLFEEGPLFKSLFPGNSPIRVVPAWNTILTKANFERTEVLPTVSRKINFRFNVRDNFPGSGAVTSKEVVFRSIATAGPFKVSYPNSSSTDTLYGGVCNHIRWDVSNTHKDPVNCKRVNIYLMPNRTNPNVTIPLLMGTENDGGELVTIPDSLIGMLRARIIVEAADNIFFDASDSDIRILAPAASNKINFNVSPEKLVFCIPSKTEIDVNTCALGNANGQLNLSILSGLPQDASYQFDQGSIPYNGSARLTVDFTNVRTSGIYNVEVIAVTDKGDTLREFIEMDLVNIDFSDLKTLYPANGLSGLPQSIEFKWAGSPNAQSYRIEIATSPSFGNTVVYSGNGILDTFFTPPVFFEESKVYYWRIIPFNRCGLGAPTLPIPFQTINKRCEETPYIGNTIVRGANKTASMPVSVKGSGTISDINVKNFNAVAVGVNSVTLTLVSPKGTRVILFDRNCGVTDQFDCTFDDEGIYNLQNGCPPTLGKIIKPFEALSKFNGEDKLGDWTMELATDRFLSGQANFYGFTMDICSELLVKNPFVLTNLGLQMNTGETRNIGMDRLESQDADNTSSELIYTIVVIPQHGDLLINGKLVDYGTRFTQKDINDGKLNYRHTGAGNETDGFLFVVEDGVGGWYGSEYFKIQIGTVANKDIETPMDIQLYPNPSRGWLQLAVSQITDQNAILRILDMQGKKMLQQDFGLKKAELLDIQELPNGLYLVELQSGRQHVTRKLLVNKSN